MKIVDGRTGRVVDFFEGVVVVGGGYQMLTFTKETRHLTPSTTLN